MTDFQRLGQQSGGFHTRAAKTWTDGNKTSRPLSVPIIQAVNHQVESSQELGRLFRTGADTLYARFGNPTVSAAARKLAVLEQAEEALVFASGMGAITTTLLAILKAGDHVVAQRDIFGQTLRFLNEVCAELGIVCDFVDATDSNEVAAAIRPDTALIYIETPSNPLLKVVDIHQLGLLARHQGIPLCVDSTFASPYLQTPLRLGATLVLHSGTKYLAGHADLMCGAVAGQADMIDRIRRIQILLGNILDPHAAWLLLRSLKTLGLRIEQQCRNALHLAQFLENQSGIGRVHYPGLESSPYYTLAQSQMEGFGGVLAFEVDGGGEGARAFVDALRLIPVATSLGSVESVIEIPADLDFSQQELGSLSPEIKVEPGLIRLSVGIENKEDLVLDLGRGLAALCQLDQ